MKNTGSYSFCFYNLKGEQMIEKKNYDIKWSITLTDAIANIEGILRQSNLTWEIEYTPKDNYYVIRIGEEKDGTC